MYAGVPIASPATVASLLPDCGANSGKTLGANIGINKEGADPVRDYKALIAAVAPHVDYAVINVSSPNTPGLRDLQSEAQLGAILAAVRSPAWRGERQLPTLRVLSCL